MLLHDKVDLLRESQWSELLETQKEQLRLLSQLAARTGLTQEQLMQGLAQVLPKLVNNLTPNGRLPTAQEAQYGR